MPNHKHFLSNSLEIAIAFFLYLIALSATNLLKSLLDGDLSLLLYLPAGIKLLSILVFQWRGAVGIGLALFSRYLFYDHTYTVFESISMAIINAGATYLVICSYMKTFNISSTLDNLNFGHILGLSTVCSIANGLLFAWLLFYFRHLEIGQYWHKAFLIVLSNFTGNAVLVWLMAYIARYHLKQNKLQKLTQSKGNDGR